MIRTTPLPLVFRMELEKIFHGFAKLMSQEQAELISSAYPGGAERTKPLAVTC